MERYEDAAMTFERAVKHNPDNELPLIYLASSFGHLGRIEDAVRLDPDYARAHAVLATLFWDVWKNDWAFDLDILSFEAEERANEHLEEALKTPTPFVHALQSRILASSGLYGDAVVEAEKAIALDANDATAHAGLAEVLVLAGKPAKANDAIERAIRLDPHHPPSYLITLGVV